MDSESESLSTPTEERRNEFQRLPIELIPKIFQYFKVPDLKNCEQTCVRWANVIRGCDLLGSKFCVTYKAITPAVAPLNNGAGEHSTRYQLSPHLDRFVQDGFGSPHCSTVKLDKFLWTNYCYSPVTNTMFDSIKLLGFLETNPKIANKIEHLVYHNNYFHHVHLITKMVSMLPNLQSITVEETPDHVKLTELLSPHLNGKWKEAEDFSVQSPVITAAEDAKTRLKNLTAFTAMDSLDEARTLALPYYPEDNTAIPCVLKYVAEYCENLVVLDLHCGRYKCEIYGQVMTYYSSFWYDVTKIVKANAGTLRTLKLSTCKMDEVRVNNERSITPSPQDSRKVYDKPNADDDYPFHYFMFSLAGTWDGMQVGLPDNGEGGDDGGDDGGAGFDLDGEDGDQIINIAEVENNEAVNDEEAAEVQHEDDGDQGAAEVQEGELEFEFDDENNQDHEPAHQHQPPPVPWINFGLNLKHLELRFHLARLPTSELDPNMVKTRTAHLLEFLETQTQLEKFKFGLLSIADKCAYKKSMFLNQIASTCTKYCQVSIDLAEQFAPGVPQEEHIALMTAPGYNWTHGPPLVFTSEEIISQNESFVKLTEDRANWSFYYVNWEDLAFSIIHTRSMANLTQLHITQAGVKENLRLKIKNGDLQEIFSEAKCLRSLCLEQCDMKWVSDMGITGLGVEACSRLGIELSTDPQIQAGELAGHPLSSLKDLRTLKLIGIGDKVTDISAQHAFCGMKLRTLVLSAPKFTADGLATLRKNLKGSGSFADDFQIVTSLTPAVLADLAKQELHSLTD